MKALQLAIMTLSLLLIILCIWNPEVPFSYDYLPHNLPEYRLPNDITFIEAFFGLCVWIIVLIADVLGITYEAANIWIFCVAGPILFVSMMLYILQLRIEIKKLKVRK